MRFSILLPTRNRLDLLKLAVESVVEQDFDDWEIVISDNASEEDVAGYVEQLDDERIRYVRSDAFLPVTDNWNLALAHSMGEYTIMLGDDDCLLRGSLRTANRILAENGDPGVLFNDAVIFAYPGVMPGWDLARVWFVYCKFVEGHRDTFWLSREAALDAVRDSADFRVTFPYNMQYWVVSRDTIHDLESYGPFYQSPYPDYYAANALLLTSDKVLVHPYPLVAVGISSKSYGFYHFNKREQEGVQFLQNVAETRLTEQVNRYILPGSDMNTSWLLAMQALFLNFGKKYPVRVSVRNYRFEQFRTMFSSLRPISRFVRAVWELGTWNEKLFWYAFLGFGLLTKLLGPRAAGRIQERTLDSVHLAHREGPNMHRRAVPYEDILQMVRGEDAGTLKESADTL